MKQPVLTQKLLDSILLGTAGIIKCSDGNTYLPNNTFVLSKRPGGAHLSVEDSGGEVLMVMEVDSDSSGNIVLENAVVQVSFPSAPERCLYETIEVVPRKRWYEFWK